MIIKTIKSSVDINKIEDIRKEAFELKENGNYYVNELLNRKEYAIGVYDKDALIGGAYFHRFNNVLMIDQLFVKKEYRNRGIARSIINKLVSCKEELKLLLGGDLNLIKVESMNEDLRSFYKELGFKQSNSDDDVFYKSM